MKDPSEVVLRVGDGRGFVVKRGQDRIVVTAAHCLPFIPPPHLASNLAERTFEALLGPLRSKPTVWAECMFVDTVFDIAILCSPDGQALYQEAEAYEELTDGIKKPLLIADAPQQERHHVRLMAADIRTPGQGLARVLSLEGLWSECSVTRRSALLWIDPPDLVVNGMSGSPVVSAEGRAIGVISTTNLCPVLADCLPRRITRPPFSTVETKALDGLNRLADT